MVIIIGLPLGVTSWVSGAESRSPPAAVAQPPLHGSVLNSMMLSATTKTDLRLYGSEGRWAGCTIRAVSRLRSPAVFLPALRAAGLMSRGWTEGGPPATAPAP